MKCWLAQFSDRPCDGRLIAAHLIPQQQIKKRWNTMAYEGHPLFEVLSLEELLRDPRGFVPACGGPMGNAGHHGMLDASRTLRIPLDMIPAETKQFAAELGLTWWLQREYGGVSMSSLEPT